MPALKMRCPSDEIFERRFSRLRSELDIPATFPDAVLAEAALVTARGPQLPPGVAPYELPDRRDVELVTIDPPTSLDLDQAFHAERRDRGYRVHYAIADVAAFVAPGGAIDIEALARGVTLYSPDRNTLLHPPSVAEDAASLAAQQDRWSVLWTIELDTDGELVGSHVQRAIVRSREKLSYSEAQTRIDNETASPSLALLAEIGRLRQERERDRGAVSLNLPSQEIVRDNGAYQLRYDTSMPVEGWNAQISLLTGIAAAGIMVDAKLGLLRTLPEPFDRTVAGLRRSAQALDIDWPSSRSYADAVRDLDPNVPNEAAMLNQAARGLRGAGYVAFDGELPEYTRHAAIASNYAHVTAPLRRVCDRFTNEILLALTAETAPPEWAVAALDGLPTVMGKARGRDRSLERSIVDLVEALLLESRVGHTFSATVVDVDEDDARVQIKDPAIVADIEPVDPTLGAVELGDEISVRLTAVDVDRRSVSFERTTFERTT